MAESNVLVIACGALARELLEIARLNALQNVTIECLPATLHNRPSEIPEAVRGRVRRARGAPGTMGVIDDGSSHRDRDGVDPVADPAIITAIIGDPTVRYDSIFVAYADCGTGGRLRAVCDEEGVEMLDGAHCYQFFATAPRFAEIQDDAIGTFYLTDFLARHFDRMVWTGLGLDRHPELLPMYFGNYTRLVYLAQSDDADLLAAAKVAAERLGLDMVVECTGYGELETAMVEFTRNQRSGAHARMDQS